MARYVKICPRCGHQNDELAEVCEEDSEFLGMVPASIARETPESAAPQAPDEPPRNTPAPSSNTSLVDVAVTQRFEQPSIVLYIETSDGKTYEVRHGNVLGQAHPSSAAHIQLEALPDLNYVHRSHCLFEFLDDAWRVRAIAQADYTNPTFVNRTRLEPGQCAVLHNGDKLTLSSVVLSVRIIEL